MLRRLLQRLAQLRLVRGVHTPRYVSRRTAYHQRRHNRRRYRGPHTSTALNTLLRVLWLRGLLWLLWLLPILL
ncbi:hypothetical protein GCM10009537_17600 [Corynebacterium riegelii]